jgi:hypothetical protein
VKREQIRFGDKLVCEGVVGLVEVLDTDLPEDELVAILLPNQHTYYVSASQLSKPTDVSKFKVGQRVHLNLLADIPERWKTQPLDKEGKLTDGEVIYIYNKEGWESWIRVQWDNGHINAYTPNALIILDETSDMPDVCDEDFDELFKANSYSYKDVLEYFFEFEDEVAPKPRVDIRYDEATKALFIIFEEKVTVCVPEVMPDVAENVAMSFCKDGDVYDEEIGCALAFFRSF